MTTTNQEQAGFDEFTTTDSSDGDADSKKKPITQRQIIGMFGNDGSIRRHDLADSTISDDEIVMWFPEHKTAPLDIPISEFSESGGWEEGETEVSDEDTRVYVIDAGDHGHVVNADKIDSLAEAINTDRDGLLEMVRTKSGCRHAENYPVLFDLSTGFVMVSPIIRDRSEIDF